MKKALSQSLLFATIFLGHAQAQSPQNCGYQLDIGTRNITPAGYNGWASLTNISGPPASQFEILLDMHGGTLHNVMQAEYTQVDGGYRVTEPKQLAKKPIAVGKSHDFSFLGKGAFLGAKPYLISINGVKCDTAAPQIGLHVSQTLFTSAGNLLLSATASDNVAVSKVVFLRNGEVIGEATSPPYSLDVNISASLNGRNAFTAVAYDHSGNTTTAEATQVFAAIGNRFLGTAPGSNADYIHAATYFNQVTPEDAGKWGSVEAARDVMDWTALDQAYDFAQSNGFPFKLHTLIWGQQAPAWMDNLSPQEQLEEIHEWMSLLAQRYPNIDSIDVVNEPLHTPPTFTQALGGAGVTGWDWVVTSFELAREYFPDAQLLINDYQVLILEQFSYEYLEVITPLLERGLLDGIGVQAHFLERADVATVAASLANLAATGLPIYVSEFDLNIANDALHANRMRDLFTTFWNNSSVVGLTNWGHLQGDVWQEHAYLIRADGSHRPGFDWMLCYYAGGTNCSVPTYEPTGWHGTATNGLLLEAEHYDEGEGLIASGDVVAYTNNGHWLSFKKVNFLGEWNKISVTYMKGSPDAGSISLHLGNLETAPVMEIALPPTAGWGSAETIELDWPTLADEQDLYVRFNGAYGVANLDSIRFHPPLSEPGLGPNLVANPGFENGTTSGWFTWDGQLSATNAFAYQGNYSLQLSNRSGNGPAAYSLQGLVTPGATYEVKMFVSIGGAASANINVTSKIGCTGDDTYSWLINPTAVTEGQWIQLTGQLTVPQCGLSDLLIYAEGPAGGIDIFIDEVSVREVQAQNLMPNGGFENGSTAGWFSWDGSVNATTSPVNSGNYALELSGRGGNGPAAYSLTSLLVPGNSYAISMAVTIQGATQAPVNITQKIECEGNANYTWLANTNAVIEGEWTTLSGVLTVPNCQITDLLIFVEGPAGGINIYVDDVQISAQ
ncbi:MAG: endo-1,4-beta-xylanase [Cellvibrionaceae bacterium]|nr:endo-1,4-beta-xylanase [Cellvibrionaceae bacterium]